MHYHKSMKVVAVRAAKLATAIVMIAGLCAGFTGRAAAHVLRTDNGVSAEMHIPPDDKPVAGRPTTIQFVFSGTDFDFDVHACGCTLTVSGGTAGLRTVPIRTFQGDSSSSRAIVTFPAAGVYGLSVRGRSEAGTFQLDYDTRVGADPAAAQANAARAKRINVLMLGIVGAVLLAMAAYYATKRRAASAPQKLGRSERQ